ncbi:MAG: glycosyltransferase [Bryobacteraceae bacterium]
MICPRSVLLMARQLDLGGTERQLCELAKALDRSRFAPHVGCFHAQGFRAEDLRAAGVPILHLPVASYLRPGALRGAWQMARYIRQHDIRIVHTFDVPLNQFGVPVARACSVPVVISSQRAHRDLLSARSPGFNRHFLRLTDMMVDAVVVNSLAVRRHLVEDERVPAARIQVCYNGLDTARFQPGPRLRPPELRDARCVIGALCAFRPEKDLPTLVAAFAQIRPLFPGLKLLLVGDGPMREPLARTIDQLGLAQDCRIEPATSEVPLWLRAIDVFVLPSLSESLSNSLMEAMACGCCVVASRVGGNPELVDDGRTGLLFRAGDAADLAACLRRLVQDEELRRELASAGSAFIARGFSLEASARRMEEIYETLLRQAVAGG